MSIVPADATEHGDRKSLFDAVLGIKPGQVIVYYRGDLARDRLRSRSLDQLGDLAWQLAQAEDKYGNKRPIRVHLTQVRIGRSCFAYLATGRGPNLAAVR